MELDTTALYGAFLRYQGVPAEGFQELIVEEAFIGPGGMVHILADDQDTDEDDELL